MVEIVFTRITNKQQKMYPIFSGSYHVMLNGLVHLSYHLFVLIHLMMIFNNDFLVVVWLYSFLLVGNGYIEGRELDNFLREFVSSVNTTDIGPEVWKPSFSNIDIFVHQKKSIMIHFGVINPISRFQICVHRDF